MEGWLLLKIFNSHCDLCNWSAIYLSVQSSTKFTPEGEIRLQNARDTTAVSLVDPTGRTVTEHRVCADTRETHDAEKILEHTRTQVPAGYHDLSFAQVDP